MDLVNKYNNCTKILQYISCINLVTFARYYKKIC